MTALDGNVIAGLLFDVFGAETTAATGVCASMVATAFRRRLREFGTRMAVCVLLRHRSACRKQSAERKPTGDGRLLR